jgi:6-pyruvoyltetrahydropterin/6-carboxytetrahydropterin synthase
MSKFQSTKKYGHEVGISACFRQWGAKSHCAQLHGYALAFKFTFEADELDERNWVVDFGGLKPLKKALEDNFDHKTVVAKDDPLIDWFHEAAAHGILDLNVVEKVGCEAFAELAFNLATEVLKEQGFAPRCRVIEVEVSEHGSNSAVFKA